MAKKAEVEKPEFPKVFVAENGNKAIALNEIQASAYKNEGFTEEE